MPIKIVDRGHNNQIDTSDDFLETQNGTIFFERDNSHVIIGKNSNSDDIYLHCGSGAVVHIGDHVRLAKARMHIVAPTKLIIAEFTSFVGSAQISTHEPAEITFGHNCLIADEVTLSVSDMHSVIDLETGARINPAQPIMLGHRVWIGARSTVLKGTTIGDGSFIGAHSLVRGTFPANVMAAGVPARIIRSNVTWRTELL
ncbi:acyltransferase [Methylobacterium sp. J-072]|uniref:acyltransferase n=1 Tax=Methylobacterium sp. J-072 TaxID=2836651 RepID=UPI001FBBBAAC|nr:acyltransferase [Methylobacterium sp. J-072]MCJ2092238.1 acyltransferase [Methylobacterium sp. J-072]